MALYGGCEIEPDLVMTTLETLESYLNGQNRVSPEDVADKYEIQELFKYLQNSQDTDTNRLAKLEWAYLGLLDEYSGSSPVTLEKSLHQNAEFFCQLIQMIFRSDKEPEDNEQAVTEQDKARAHQAYMLLTQWKRMPGMSDSGVINEQELMDWVNIARELCNESESPGCV